MIEHGRMAKAALGSSNGVGNFPASFHLPSDTNTQDWYAALQTFMGVVPPLPGNGVDNLTMLKWLYDATGGLLPKGDDVEEWAFAELNATNPDAIRAAMLNFRGVLVGCSLTDQAENEFNNSQPWEVTPQEQPDPSMGHDILLVAYDQLSYKFVTWGATQLALVDWELGEVQAGDLEAWVFITQEDADRNGVDMQALKAEILALGGTQDVPPGPAPDAPPPQPGPAPQPSPAPPAPLPDTPPAPGPVVQFFGELSKDLKALVYKIDCFVEDNS
jgi:hypothetical protein